MKRRLLLSGIATAIAVWFTKAFKRWQPEPVPPEEVWIEVQRRFNEVTGMAPRKEETCKVAIWEMDGTACVTVGSGSFSFSATCEIEKARWILAPFNIESMNGTISWHVT